MSKTILVTGGAASGKSRWAASYLSACDNVLYLNVTDKLDNDTMGRIEYNSKHNFVEWNITEGVTDNPAELIANHKFVIFDNLASYTSKKIKKMCPDISLADDNTIKEIEKNIT